MKIVGCDSVCIVIMQSAHRKPHVVPKFIRFTPYSVACCELLRPYKKSQMLHWELVMPQCFTESLRNYLVSGVVRLFNSLCPFIFIHIISQDLKKMFIHQLIMSSFKCNSKPNRILALQCALADQDVDHESSINRCISR